MKLRNLFYSTPKSSVKWSRYFDVYQRYLEKYEGKNITFIEVGVQDGGSLEMWSKFFGPDSKIYGIDIDPKCADLVYDNPNIKIIIGDQESPEFWDKTLKEIGPIDAIVEDGGHTMQQQIVSFEKVFPVIKFGGVYICEDTHTSYFHTHNGGYRNPNTFIEYSKDFIDILHLADTSMYGSVGQSNLNHVINGHKNLVTKKFAYDLSSIHYYDSMVIIEKDERVKMNLENKF